MTHEYSHTVIAHLLAQMEFDASDEGAMAELAELVDGPGPPPDNLLDHARAMVGYGVWQIYCAQTGQKIDPKEKRITGSQMKKAVATVWSEVNEVLTHCFDFLYFYDRDVEHYVSSIWRSWDVNPGIESRLGKYLVRSLCAVHTRNIDLPRDGIKKTISDTMGIIKKASEGLDSKSYIVKALNELQSNSAAFVDELTWHSLLIRFARFMMYFPDTARILGEDNASFATKYTFESRQFGATPIGNPLRFIKKFATDQGTHKAKSAWMLNQLAFAEI